MYTISESFGPISRDDLEQFEVTSGLSIPENYRKFLLETNGGIPEPDAFLIPNCETKAIVGLLYGLQTEPPSFDIAHQLLSLRDRLPEGCIPIGEDPGGNLLLLGTLDAERGKIFFWDRDYFLDTSNDEGNTYEIADGIFEFLESLQE